MTEPRIYVACLAAYNNGSLHGRWIDANQSVDDIEADVQAMLNASPENKTCQWCGAVMDITEGRVRWNTRCTHGQHWPGHAEEWAIHGAPRRTLSYPFTQKGGTRGMFLGHPAHLEAKAKGEISMLGKQQSGRSVHTDVLSVPRDMAKAGLPEIQSPAGAMAPPVGMTLATDAAPCSGQSCSSEQLRGAGHHPARVGKEISGWPKSRSIRTTRMNAGSPTGREPYGDGVSVVVAGVTSCQGDRESRSQGEGAQVVTMSNDGKPA